MKRQRRTIGAIVEVDLGDGHYTYARILDEASFAIYNLHSTSKVSDITAIISRPILFIVAVYDYVITQGTWLKIGSAPLEEHLRILPMQFIQDALRPEFFSHYNPNTGEITPTTKEECRGLERAAVWDANHVVDRVRDHYAGKPCIWLKSELELFKS